MYLLRPRRCSALGTSTHVHIEGIGVVIDDIPLGGIGRCRRTGFVSIGTCKADSPLGGILMFVVGLAAYPAELDS